MKSHKFLYAYDQTGAHTPKINSYPIDAATNTGSEGTMVCLLNGKVVKVNANSQAAILGVTAMPHDGASDGQTTLFIRVYDSPTAVFKCKPENCELVNETAGAAAFVDNLVATAANDQFNYGYLKLKKAPNVTVSNPVIITDFVTGTGTISATLTGGVLVGDTAMIFPPLLSVAFALNAACNNLDMNTTGGTVLKVIKNDIDSEDVYVMPALHLLGNKAS